MCALADLAWTTAMTRLTTRSVQRGPGRDVHTTMSTWMTAKPAPVTKMTVKPNTVRPNTVTWTTAKVVIGAAPNTVTWTTVKVMIGAAAVVGARVASAESAAAASGVNCTSLSTRMHSARELPCMDGHEYIWALHSYDPARGITQTHTCCVACQVTRRMSVGRIRHWVSFLRRTTSPIAAARQETAHMWGGRAAKCIHLMIHTVTRTVDCTPPARPPAARSWCPVGWPLPRPGLALRL